MNIIDQASLMEEQELRKLIQELEALADVIGQREELEYDLLDLQNELAETEDADVSDLEMQIEEVEKQLQEI